MCLWAIYIFPESVHIFPPAEKADPSWEYVYNSLTDTWMWKLGLRPRYSFSGNICFKFSAFCLCSASLYPLKELQSHQFEKMCDLSAKWPFQGAACSLCSQEQIRNNSWKWIHSTDTNKEYSALTLLAVLYACEQQDKNLIPVTFGGIRKQAPSKRVMSSPLEHKIIFFSEFRLGDLMLYIATKFN
jgi:hypothetical protein